MTLTTVDENNLENSDVIQDLSEQLVDAAHVFQEAARKLQNGELVSANASKDMGREYRKVATLYFEERNRLVEKRKKELGIVYDYALDLAKARDTIERRMARLRGAADY